MGDDGYKLITNFEATVASWPIFKTKINAFFEARELDYILNTDLLDKSTSIPLTTLAQERRRKDDLKVKSFLLNKLSDDAIRLVGDAKTGHEMWTRLATQYESNSMQSKISRLDRLLDMKYDSSRDVSACLGSLASQINVLKQTGTLDWDELFTVSALRVFSRAEGFGNLIAALKTQDSSHITRERVTRLITERALELNDPSQGKQQTKPEPKSAFNNRDRNSKLTCNNCHKTGHVKANCWARGGDAEGKGPNQNKTATKIANQNSKNDHLKDKEPKQALNYAFIVGSNNISDEKWLLDSGSTQHYSKDKSVFTNFEAIQDKLHVGNGQEVAIEGKGDVTFVFNNPVRSITLTDVYYAPDLECNLISESRMDSHGLTETTAKGRKEFRNNDGILILSAKLTKGHYCIDGSVVPNKNTVHSSYITSLQQWHARMGCLHTKALEVLKKQELINGYDYTGSSDFKCEICIRAKSTREPFKTSTNPPAKHPMDLIHMDIAVINIPGRNLEKYALMIVDDHSSCKIVFPIANKSGETILKEVKSRLGWAERVTNRKLKAVRTDNAKEFKHGQFSDWLQTNNIEQQYSVKYEHEQNGKIERTNRTILDKARCMLLRSNLPKKFWPDALVTAAFVANRSPVYNMDSTPIEAFTDVKPTLKKVRVFGSLAWAHVENEKLTGRNKLNERAVSFRLIGYAQGGHAYKLINQSGEVVIAVNVQFDEENLKGTFSNYGNNQGESTSKTIVDELDDDESSGSEIDEVNQENTKVMPETPRRDFTIDLPIEPSPDRTPRRSERLKSKTTHICYINESDYVEKTHPKESKEAKQLEFNTLKRFGTFELTSLPPDKKLLGGKWILKEKSDGRIKARWVVKGYKQVEGIDYTETYAPVARISTVRIALTLAVQLNLNIIQFDVTAAYLNGYMEEEVYTVQPLGFEKGKNLVARMVKSIYGSKQGARNWNKRLNEEMAKLNMKPLQSDNCVYIHGTLKEVKNFVMAIIYVDDILLLSHNSATSISNKIEKELSTIFEIRKVSTGPKYEYLGIEIHRKADCINLIQSKLSKKILERFELGGEKLWATPMDSTYVLGQAIEGESRTNEPYRSIVGSLMYLATSTRPDISFAVGMLSRFLENPGEKHWIAAKRVVGYIRGTLNNGLCFKKDKLIEVQGWSDSDWAADTETGKSVGGYCIKLAGCLVSWKSKRQRTIATSSTHAEIEACYNGTLEGLWINGLLKELGMEGMEPTLWNLDNQPMIAVINSERNIDRVKHLLVKVYYLRQLIESQQIKTTYCPTGEMSADIFTKPIAATLFNRHKHGIGVLESLHDKGEC